MCMGNHSAWTKRKINGTTFWFAGDLDVAATLAGLPTGPDVTARAASIVQNADTLFAVIADRPDGILAATDPCRSHPIFIAQETKPPGRMFMGGDARATRDAAGKYTFNSEAVREAAMAGFVTGPNTLVEGLHQLDPGTVTFVPADGSVISHHRAFVYSPMASSADTVNLGEQLNHVIDMAMDRVLSAAGDSPIWVPLSGGLDSRLILARLVSSGASNLKAFSYGPRGNPDAEVARTVADHLGVEWRFVDTPGRDIRAFFNGPARRDFWTFADGLSSTPNNQDLIPLVHLREKGLLPDDAMIVNGQTGDFISGGHVPEFLFDVPLTVDQLLNAIVDRHYSLWRSLRNTANIDAAKNRVRAVLELDSTPETMLDRNAAIALWERFEFEGRQAKYIVNGQRSYDYLGLRWALPLWDGAMVRFWRDTPVALKRDQRLYRETLKTWDPTGVFSKPMRAVTAWSRPIAAALLPISIATRLIAGRARRDRWITYARYLDRFGSHYQAFGWRHFAKHAPDARNPHAYYARAWLNDLGAAWPGTTDPGDTAGP